MERRSGALLTLATVALAGAGCPRGTGTSASTAPVARPAVDEVGAAARKGRDGKPVTIGFVRRGTPGARGTILVLGGPYCIEWFGLALEPSYEVVYFDPSPASLLLSERVADVEAVRRKIGRDQVFVFGHSESGAVALEYAAAHRGHVRGLVWVAGLNDHPRSLALEFRMLARAATSPEKKRHFEAIAAKPRFGVIDLMLSLQSRKLAPKCRFPERCRRGLVRAGEALRTLGYHRALARHLPATPPTPRDRITALVTPDLHGMAFLDYRSEASAVARLATLPILLIQGGRDTVVHPETTRALARSLPRARLVELPDCGHMPFLEQPERFRRELRAFLGVPDGQAPAASRLPAGWKPPYLTGPATPEALDAQAREAESHQIRRRADAMLAAACRLFGQGTPPRLLSRLRATPAEHATFLSLHCPKVGHGDH